jgi:putative ABC transport system permease protein
VNYLTLFVRAVASMRYNKMRSFLTTLGIIIGVTTIIAIVALLKGLDRTIDQEFSSLGTKTIYVQKMELEIGLRRHRDFEDIAKRPDLTLADAAAISKIPTVRAAVPSIHEDLGTLKRGVYEADDCTLTGVGEGGDLTGNWVVAQGRFITRYDERHRNMVCVIGSYVADNLFGPGEDPLYQALIVEGHRYVVVGLLEEKGASFGHPQDNQIFIPVETYLKYYPPPEGRASVFRGIRIEVLPEENVPVETAVTDVEELLRIRRGLRYYEDDDFGLNTQESMLSSLNTIRSVLWLVMVGVAGISLLVGGIGIMNIMLVSVAERTREIGIRKAVGASDADITVQFLSEAVALSSIGGVVGIVVGLAVGAFVSAITPLQAAAPWWTVVLGVGFSAAVGILFGIYPARKASRLNPIAAIRYE